MKSILDDSALVVLSKAKHTEPLRAVLGEFHLVETAEALDNSRGHVLIGFATGIVVKSSVLSRFAQCINVHGGTPEYPGRDPHHWACYERAETFGATVHEMAGSVDTGRILAVTSEPVPHGAGPADYRDVGLRCSFRALASVKAKLARDEFQYSGDVWSRIPFRRRDLVDLCNFSGLDAAEIALRKRATSGFESYWIEGT